MTLIEALIVFPPIIFMLLIIQAFFSYSLQREKWNGGISPYNGLPWIHIHTNELGNKIYSDGQCQIYITWDSITYE